MVLCLLLLLFIKNLFLLISGIGLFITLNFGLLKILMVKSLVLSGIFLKLFLSYTLLLSICTIVPIIVAVAFFTLAERKIMASIQRRRGPNIVGVGGLLQPFADGLKAVVKELVLPAKAGKFLFFLAPSIAFIFSLLNWSFIPFSYSDTISDFNYSLFVLYAFSSLSVYGIILAGWVSQSKYPFFGAVRSSAQMISYEVSIGLVFLILGIVAHSFNFSDIVYWQEVNGWLIWFLFPVACVFLVSAIAETNRAPFDLPEAEAEIVAGYNLEYSGIVFALFFLGEYSNIFLMCTVFSILFLGG